MYGLSMVKSIARALHIVYCLDKKMRIIFLRAFRNFSEYGRFLEDKKEIKRMVVHV